MQPPPRKGNYAKFLKNVHAEQAAKLQAKNQHECDLLEDIRNFTIKKSAIEKSYSEALLKISSAYLNKKIPNIPDLKVDGAEEKWNMWNVWRTVLEENEKLARARLAAVEVFQQQIADDAKILRMHKLQISKKNVHLPDTQNVEFLKKLPDWLIIFPEILSANQRAPLGILHAVCRAVDQLMIVQKELQTCVQDVDKTKKLYFDEEHCARDVRDKAKDIEEKLKKKKGSFFQSITSLQKNSAKVSSKRDALEEKSTGARNDYLLSLASANAHQNRYFAIDLQNTMQYLEQGVYDKVAEYLTLMGRTELLTCLATQNSYGKIRDQAQQLTREYNIKCCCLYYPVLKQHIQYDYEPCDNDVIDKVTADHSAASSLGKEARRWATRIAREVGSIRENSRKLQVLYQLKESGQKSDPNDPNGPDIDTKIDDVKQNVRRAETAKMKAEARLECLRNGGVNVEEFLQEVETLNVQDIQRSASSLSVRTDTSGTAEHPSSDSFYDSDNDAGSDLTTVERPGSMRSTGHQEEDSSEERQRHDSSEVDALLEQEKQRIEDITAGWDDPANLDWSKLDEDESAVTQETDEVPSTEQIFKCTALYSYNAQNPDELTIVESEQLEVVGEGDGDGWLRARNYRGEEGFVPQNYLDVEREPETQSSLVSHGPGLVQQISFSSVDYTIDDHDAVDPDAHIQKTAQDSFVQNHIGTEEWCISLYDYDATCDEELTFIEGEIIKVLRKEPHDFDDGWWEGELRDQKGLFPSLVVELCAPDGSPLSALEDDITPPPSFAPPPEHTPPEVPDYILTDEFEHSELNDSGGDKPAFVSERSGFAINLTRNQKEQYGMQFDNDENEEAPGITVEEAKEETNAAVEKAKKKVVKKTDDSNFGLGVAQIVITAATPMEEIEHSFPGDEEAEKEDEEKSAPEQDKKVSQEKEVVVEEEVEEIEAPKPPEPVEEPEEKIDDLPADSGPFPVSSSSGSDGAESISGPSTAENSQSLPPRPTESESQSKTESQPIQESQTEPEPESELEASESPEIIPNKMLVGGRASIPDELQPDQLEKLQSLKESNA